MSGKEFEHSSQVLATRRKQFKPQCLGNGPQKAEPQSLEEVDILYEKNELGTGEEVGASNQHWHDSKEKLALENRCMTLKKDGEWNAMDCNNIHVKVYVCETVNEKTTDAITTMEKLTHISTEKATVASAIVTSVEEAMTASSVAVTMVVKNITAKSSGIMRTDGMLTTETTLSLGTSSAREEGKVDAFVEKRAILIGATVGGLLLAILSLVIVFLLYRHTTRKKGSKSADCMFSLNHNLGQTDLQTTREKGNAAIECETSYYNLTDNKTKIYAHGPEEQNSTCSGKSNNEMNEKVASFKKNEQTPLSVAKTVVNSNLSYEEDMTIVDNEIYLSSNSPGLMRVADGVKSKSETSPCGILMTENDIYGSGDQRSQFSQPSAMPSDGQCCDTVVLSEVRRDQINTSVMIDNDIYVSNSNENQECELEMVENDIYDSGSGDSISDDNTAPHLVSSC